MSQSQATKSTCATSNDVMSPETPEFSSPVKDNSGWRSEFKKLQDENSLLTRNYIDLKGKYAKNRKSLDYYWNKSKDLEEKNNSLTKEKKASEDEQTLQTKISELTAMNADLEKEKQQLTAMNADLEKEKQQLMAKNVSLEKERKHLQAKNLDLEQKNTDFEAKLGLCSTEIENGIATLKSEYESQLDDLQTQLNMKSMKERYLEGQLSEEMATSKKRGQRINKLGKALAELKRTNRKLYRENSELIAALSDDKDEIQQQKRLIDQTRSKITEVETQANKISEKVTSLSDEKVYLEKQVAVGKEERKNWESIYNRFRSECPGFSPGNVNSSLQLFTVLAHFVKTWCAAKDQRSKRKQAVASIKIEQKSQKQRFVETVSSTKNDSLDFYRTIFYDDDRGLGQPQKRSRLDAPAEIIDVARKVIMLEAASEDQRCEEDQCQVKKSVFARIGW